MQQSCVLTIYAIIGSTIYYTGSRKTLGNTSPDVYEPIVARGRFVSPFKSQSTAAGLLCRDGKVNGKKGMLMSFEAWPTMFPFDTL